MIDLKCLQEITTLPGISGFEHDVVNYLKPIYQNLGMKCQQDGIGSLMAIDHGKDVTMMVASHMDEVGFIIESIDEHGCLFLKTIGSIWPAMLMGQWFRVVTRDGKHYDGLMGSIASHGLPAEERKKVMPIEKLYLDLGVSNRQEVLNLGIHVGDMVVPWPHFEIMNNKDYVSAKAFDDRIGVFIEVELAKRLAQKTSITMVYGNTVQEEPGLRGARTLADISHSDMCFAIDTTLAGDTPLNQNICKLGGGVVISMIDSNSIAPRKLVQYVSHIAKQHNISTQYAVFNKGGTDSGNIHKTHAGIVNMTLSIPIRYMHTNSSIISIKDVESCIALLEAIAMDMNKETFEKLL